MKISSLTLLLLIAFFPCSGQNNTNSVQKFYYVIKQQADSMGRMLLKKDTEKFLSYTSPKVLENMGGKERMIEVMDSAFKNMEKDGTIFLSVSFGHPSKILNMGKELQCTLPQIIEVQVPEGRVITHSTLIVISEDYGKTWFFVDTSGKDIQSMQVLLPNLSTELIIPEKPKTIFYEN